MYTHRNFAKAHVLRGQDSKKKKFKNENTVVLRAGEGELGAIFPPKEAFIIFVVVVISTEKLQRKKNSKTSSPSWMLNLN